MLINLKYQADATLSAHAHDVCVGSNILYMLGAPYFDREYIIRKRKAAMNLFIGMRQFGISAFGMLNSFDLRGATKSDFKNQDTYKQ